MDLFVINVCITDCISNLSCLHISNSFDHCFQICLCVCIRHIVNDRSNSLRNCLGRHNNNILILCQCLCLISSKNNVLVVRKDKNMFCVHLIDCIEHVFCTWIHCLTAFDNVVSSKLTENLIHSFSDRNCNKSDFFARLRLFRFSLLCSQFLRIFDQSLLMLFSHIINLHT